MVKTRSGSGGSGSGSSTYSNSGRISKDGSGRSSGLPISPGGYAAIHMDLKSLLSRCSVKYLDNVWKNIKKAAEKRAVRAGADELGNTPSDLTDFNVWREYQGKDAAQAKFLCFRPPFARPPLPLVLVCEAFAKFKQDAADGVPEEVDMDFAEAFWSQVQADKYVQDHEEAVKSILRVPVSSYLGQDVTPYFVLQGRTEADGILLGSHLIRLAFEFKSQAGNAGEPDFQVLDGFLRACTLQSSNVRGCRQYALAICLLGPRLEVWGATVEDGKVWAEPFAESKCYGPDEYLVATARIWRAIRLFVQGYQVVPLESPPLPWPITMNTNVHWLAEGKLVFRYVNSEGEPEVAKFVSKYGLDAHEAWLPYAPELHGEVFEKHGVRMIRMEYLSRKRGWEPADEVVEHVKGDEVHVAKLRECIGVALNAGHSKGFVHGDLRLCNILLLRSQVEADGYPKYHAKIVDFDWAGKAGHVAYPRMNRSITWPPGARYGVAITKAHDIYFKDNLVEQLKKPTTVFKERSGSQPMLLAS